MILLSFDTEEFDVPKEHGVEIPLEEQVRISTIGTNKILDCLKTNGIKATFFCTANFALHSKETIMRIQNEGHEIASHGYNHWTFQIEDLKKSKQVLEEMTGLRVRGYRQARMMPVPEKEIRDAGYEYNSEDPDNSKKFDEYINRRNQAEEMFKAAMRIAESENNCPHTTQTEEMLIAQDIWQVIRHQLYLDRGGDPNGMVVDANKPYSRSGEALPKIKKVKGADDESINDF